MSSSLEKFLIEKIQLSDAEIIDIQGCFQKININKNKFWVQKGEICQHLAFIESGILHLTGEIDDTTATLQFFFKEMFVTSLKSFAFQNPSEWGIQALTDCELWLINRANHLQLLDKYKLWLELDNMLLLQAYTSLEYKTLSSSRLNSEQRFDKLFTENPSIFNQVSLKHIASYLGIRPETLSRLRKKHLK
jgi:CRP-like cAMP-binding protein